MTFAPISWAEDHPYTAGGIALVLVVGAIVVLRSQSAAPVSAATGGPSDAELSYAAQQSQNNATIAAQTAQYSTTLSLDAQDNAAKLALAKVDQATAITGQGYQYQTAQGSLDAQVSIANLSAQVAEYQTSSAQAVALATTAAQEDIQKLITDATVTTNHDNNATVLGVSDINAQTQRAISANQTQALIQQSADNRDVAVAAINEKGQESSNSLIDGLVGAAALAFL